MRAGIVCLVLGYVLSQFYRAFLAVLTPVLKVELGATAADLAAASGLWFLAFALMQIPVGEALDRIGPRLTTAVLLGFGGAGGAAVFAMASGPLSIDIAMVLIGIGCSPVLMASYFIFARVFPPAVFGTLAGAVIGIGSLGNIASSLPLSAAVEAFGWRGTLWGMSAVTLAVALLIGLLVRDPERVAAQAKGSILDLLRMPALWPILIVASVANTAGSVVTYGIGRGLSSLQRWPRLRIPPEAMARAEGWFQRWGVWVLLLSWAPGGDIACAVAGALRTPLWLFVLLVGIAKTARYAVLAALTLGLFG